MNIKSIVGIIGLGVFTAVLWYTATEIDKKIEVPHASAEDHHNSGDEVAGYEIYPGDVVEKIEQTEDVVLLDVRTLEEYEEVHLKNALLLPVQELSQQSLNEIDLGENAKDKEIIIYCRSGARSKTAYDIMKSLGYTNIKSVAGGMIHWEEDNYPFTETGTYTGVVVDSGNEAGTENGPKLAIDRKLHDFGEVPQYGGKVETSFVVSNTGDEVLEIGTLTTSCSCTSASISKTSLKPNESANLTVIFDPDFHEEPVDVFKRTVFIPTNDPNNSEGEVTVQVDILEGE